MPDKTPENYPEADVRFQEFLTSLRFLLNNLDLYISQKEKQEPNTFCSLRFNLNHIRLILLL